MRGANRGWWEGGRFAWFPAFWMWWTFGLYSPQNFQRWLLSVSRHKPRPSTTHGLPSGSVNPDSIGVIAGPLILSPSSFPPHCMQGPAPFPPHCMQTWYSDHTREEGILASEVGRTGLRVPLYHFLPHEASRSCVHLHREYCIMPALEGFWFTGGLWLNEAVWRRAACSRCWTNTPLFSSWSCIMAAVTWAPAPATTHVDRGEESFRQLSYHLPVFWASLETLKDILR